MLVRLATQQRIGLIAVCSIALLIAFVFIAMSHLAERAHSQDKQISGLRRVADAALRFRSARNRWPQDVRELAEPGCMPGPCLFSRVPADPWGHELVVESDGGLFTVRSIGRNGQADVDDLALTVSAAP